jgi:hypothetical protein
LVFIHRYPRNHLTASAEFCSAKPEGAVVFAKACEIGLQGIVSKREGSFDRSGKSRNG